MSDYAIAIYIRLSLEDSQTDSMSIQNQRLYLLEHAMKLPEYTGAEIMEFTDNGFSGTNFERPAVQRLLDLVREGRIDCILVKDFSRFGRNSIETGLNKIPTFGHHRHHTRPPMFTTFGRQWHRIRPAWAPHSAG